MIIGKSKPAPCRAGTQNPGAIPCGTKMPVKRVFVSAADCRASARAGTIASSSGSAIATPAPRRNVRRDRCFL